MPDRDELPVARLRAAGAVIVGKTNVPELTLEGYTKNDLFGVTRNPWDTRLTPGGSSGGAAAGVAAGLVPAAIGTDGGGSIRRPACHTGLVGWKPSTGRIPRIDGFPPILTDFETIGTLTRSVDDALLLDSGHGRPRRRATAARSTPLRRSWPERRLAHPLHPAVWRRSGRSRSGRGHRRRRPKLWRGKAIKFRRKSVFFDLEDAARIWHVISRAGVAWLMGWEDGRLGAMAGASVRAMAADGAKLTGADYIDALERVAAFRRRCRRTVRQRPISFSRRRPPLCRGRPRHPIRIGSRIAPAGPRDHAVFTGWVNIAGLPAISLPVAVSQLGLPIGVQFVAGFAGDSGLARLRP